MKSNWVLAVVCAFIAGSLVTGAAVFADDDEDELSELACEVGRVMTGILFEDDDEIIDVICDIGAPGPHTTISSYQKTAKFLLDPAPSSTTLSHTPGIVTCDAGDIATGGGGAGDLAGFGFMDLTESRPFPSDVSMIPTGWNATISWKFQISGFTGNVYVVCLDVTP